MSVCEKNAERETVNVMDFAASKICLLIEFLAMQYSADARYRMCVSCMNIDTKISQYTNRTIYGPRSSCVSQR